MCHTACLDSLILFQPCHSLLIYPILYHLIYILLLMTKQLLARCLKATSNLVEVSATFLILGSIFAVFLYEVKRTLLKICVGTFLMVTPSLIRVAIMALKNILKITIKNKLKSKISVKMCNNKFFL